MIKLDLIQPHTYGKLGGHPCKCCPNAVVMDSEVVVNLYNEWGFAIHDQLEPLEHLLNVIKDVFHEED